MFTVHSVSPLTCEQEVLTALQEITTQVAAQASLDSLWQQLKIPAPVPSKQSKKRRHQKSPPPIWSSPASTSSRHNEGWDGLPWDDAFAAGLPLRSPQRTTYATPSDHSSDNWEVDGDSE